MVPITVTKFGLEQVMLGVRNCLSQMGLYQFSVLGEDSDYKPADGVYWCGTARRLKGTERKHVILVGGELGYTQCGNAAQA